MKPFCFSIPFVTALVGASNYRDIPYKIKESIRNPPPGWVRHDSAPSDHLISLKIALPQPHFPILERHLWEVSDPNHDRYGAYLSKAETDALMAPHPETLDTVNAWLSSYGIKEEDLHRSPAQDWVTIHVPVALAEEMLNTKYYVYTDSDTGERIVRTTSYSLPENLHEHIELVQPTTMFNRVKPLRSTLHWSGPTAPLSDPPNKTILGPCGNPVDAKCNSTVTIDCLRQIYNFVGYNTSATNGNKIAVTAYHNDSANYEDLQLFYQWQNPAAYNSSYTFVSINGAFNNQTVNGTSDESNLDAQLAFGLTYPTPAIFLSTIGASPPFIPDLDRKEGGEPWADWALFMLSYDDPPQTISTSYGSDEQTVPFTYATRVCDTLAALGVRGISLLFSSGDGGVGSLYTTNPATQKCISNDGSNRTVFIPQFPASCPYVTAVGGTVHIPEVAASFSGGGFSNHFSRPSYQHESVGRYLENLAPGTYDGLYNPNGRAIPDVASQSDWLVYVRPGHIKAYIGGTSCAAPTFAALISMLNDARINAGKFPLGFLNPMLYQKGHTVLNDVTVGSNPGCGTKGFNATVGWDPLTGLGTPNFQKLLALVVPNHC